MLKFMCCAQGCNWRAEYPEDAPPEREKYSGYTPFFRCPCCATENSVHWVCQADGCDERATGQKQWGWRCADHRHERD